MHGIICCARLSGGASQETYRIETQTAQGSRCYALRRSPGGEFLGRQSGRPGLATEAHLMRLAAAAGVPTPNIIYVLERSDDLGDGFLMDWLSGETLGSRLVKASRYAQLRTHLAVRCGEILARIHTIDLDAHGLGKLLDRVAPREYVEQTWRRYQRLNTPQPMIDYTARWLLANLPTTSRTTLVHNDFRNGNLMCSDDDLIAVLDWEVAHIGDPMRDLGWLCTNSWRFGCRDFPVGGFGHYRDLFTAYERVASTKIDATQVRYWEVFGSFWWAVGCLDMAQHYREGPDRSVERPAIGRRSSECQIDCMNLLMPGPAERLVVYPAQDFAMPSFAELLTSVREFLRHDLGATLSERDRFLARVAANSLDICLREHPSWAALRDGELKRLRALFACEDDYATLVWRLVHALRDGSMSLESPGLHDYLRYSVVNRVAIDQPTYSGLRGY